MKKIIMVILFAATAVGVTASAVTNCHNMSQAGLFDPSAASSTASHSSSSNTSNAVQ